VRHPIERRTFHHRFRVLGGQHAGRSAGIDMLGRAHAALPAAQRGYVYGWEHFNVAALVKANAIR
jgi:hypothetical protein